MRESRNGLRPVTLKIGDGRGKIVDYKKGYFHCFVTTGNQENGLYATAIIEMEDGTIKEREAIEVKFDDVD
ncbi:MAG: hypothetical protein ACRCSY_07890 [Cetobacterium sp.]